jgi:hypothetical protein
VGGVEWLNDGRVQGLVLGGGGLLVWALGWYVASRGRWQRTSVLSAVAILCLGVYLTGEALGALGPDLPSWTRWLRQTWWATSVAPAAWLALTLALLDDESTHPRRRLSLAVTVVAFALAAGFAILGVVSELVQEWSAPYLVNTGARHITAGPLLLPFQIYVLVCLMWGGGNLVRLWQAGPSGSPLRARWSWLLASATLFLVGGAWIVIASGIYLLVGLPGQVALIAGMLILGWNMARYGALLADEQLRGDFLAYGATMLAIIGLYGAILLTLAPDYAWLERGLPLLLLVMTTHVLVDTRGHLLDRLLYAPLLGTLRGQLRDLGNRVVRQPDELSALADVRETVDQILREQASSSPPLRVLVEGALRHLNDLPALSEHALLDELASQDGTPLERATELRNQLEQAIERLRPSGPRPSPGASAIGGWLHYLALREAYVDGRPNKQIMQRYALSEGTFHRARRRAVDALTADLAQRAARESPSTSSGATRSVV